MDSPEYRVVLFPLGGYLGSAPIQMGTRFGYRTALGAAILVRQSDENLSSTGVPPIYAITRVFVGDEFAGRNGGAGIQEIDHAGVWTAVSINAVLELVDQIHSARIFENTSGFTAGEAIVGPDRRPQWPAGLHPDLHAPLIWLRPAGTFTLDAHHPDEVFFRVVKPGRGYLTEAVIAGQDVKPGDRLSFLAGGGPTKLMGLRFEVAAGAAVSFPSGSGAIELLTAGRLATATNRGIVPLKSESVSVAGDLPLLRCQMSALSEKASGNTSELTAQWRFQLLPPSFNDPVLKLAVELDAQGQQDAAGSAHVSFNWATLRPMDLGDMWLSYFFPMSADAKKNDAVLAQLRARGILQAIATMN
jgi:hypothetical protein